MTVNLSVCLLVCQQNYANTTGWIFMKENETMGLDSTKIPFILGFGRVLRSLSALAHTLYFV